MRISDWSSDVCSSDLLVGAKAPAVASTCPVDVIQQVLRLPPPRLRIQEFEEDMGGEGFFGVVGDDAARDVAQLSKDDLGHLRPRRAFRVRRLALPQSMQGSMFQQMGRIVPVPIERSEEHTSELQSLM